MKRKFFTSILILLVAFTLSFTSVFADTPLGSDQGAPEDQQTQSQSSEDENTDADPVENPDQNADATKNDEGQQEIDANVENEQNASEEPAAAQALRAPAPVTYEKLTFSTKSLALKAKLISSNKDNSKTLTWGKNINYVFTLTPQGGAPGEKKTVNVSLANTYKSPTVEKVVDFGDLTFDKPGEYKYTVTETLKTNSADLYSKFFTRNDTKVRTVTITVTANSDNKLEAKASVSGGAFNNSVFDIDRPYSVMVRPSGINKVKTSLPRGFKHATVYQCEGRSTSTGTYIVWYSVGGAKGYIIYKKAGTTGKWKYVKKVKGYSYLSYRDKHVRNGGFYQYKVIAYTKKTKKKPAINPKDNTGIMSTYFLTKPVCSQSGKTVSWRTNSKADGMRVEVSKNNIFIGSQVYMVPKGRNSLVIPNFSTGNGGYKYVRVMPYKKFDGRYHYGLPWLNGYTYKNFYTNVEFIVKDQFKNESSKHQNSRDVKEMLSMAGQKMWGWDTTQGITYDGKYAYMNVENRYANSIKVIKMDTTNNFKVVKVSAPVQGCHGNDITYNSDTKKLYITYSYFNKRYVARMNPNTMKYEGRNYIKVPYHIAGPHGHKAIRNLNCYNEIHYDNVKKQYLLKKKESHSMIVLDKNFKVIRYMRIHERVEITNQNMQATPEFFFRVQSNYQSNQKNNYVTVFDWHGTYITHFNLKFDGVLGKAELENIFFIGDQMYGACYKKWWDKMPVGSTVKLDKVKKHGKWVFKTKKVTKANQNSLRQLRRTSYIFRIKAFG